MYSPPPYAVADAMPDERALFIRRVYGHLAGAIGLFTLLEVILLHSPLAGMITQFAVSNGRFGWLAILGGFVLIGWLARNMAENVASTQMQYLGLGLYIVAEAIIFVPILVVATAMSSPTLLPTAVILTMLMFIGLTVVAFTTKKDFSFLGSILSVGGLVAIGLIVCGAIFGFNLGLWFAGGMVLLACGSILYDTSKIMNTFTSEGYVAAALSLFASVALLFWYVLSILLRLSRR
jgi:FtsH-binding integral membrane protein